MIFPARSSFAAVGTGDKRALACKSMAVLFE